MVIGLERIDRQTLSRTRSISSSPPRHLPQVFPSTPPDAADFAVLTELIKLETVTLGPA